MPDSIADEKVLKRSLKKNKELVRKAENEARKAAIAVKAGRQPQDGIGILSRMAGFFGQRLYFGNKTKAYSDKLKIDTDKCVGCVNHCPKKAITLLGKAVVEQSVIEKYL